MPRFFDELKDVGSAVKRGAKTVAEGIYSQEASREDVERIKHTFTTFDKRGFEEPNDFRDIPRAILRGIDAGSMKVADVGYTLGDIAGRRTSEGLTSLITLPLKPVAESSRQDIIGRSGTVGGVSGGIGGTLAPYIAATAVAPEVTLPALTAQGLAIAANAADRYHLGEISGRQAVFDIITNAGPEALPVIAKGARPAFQKFGLFLESPEGAKAAEDALEAVELKRKRPTRVSRMTPEEMDEVQVPHTVEEWLGVRDVQHVARQERIARILQKIKDPLPLRGTRFDKKGNPIKPNPKSLYAEDVFTVDGNLYNERLLMADALMEEPVPVITVGRQRLAGKSATGKQRLVNISEQEARALNELIMDVGPNPTVDQVRKVLKEAGKPSKTVSGIKDLKTIEANKQAATDIPEAAEELAPEKVSVKVSGTKVRMVHEYITQKAPKINRTIRRPEPKDANFRQAWAKVQNINNELTNEILPAKEAAAANIAKYTTALRGDENRLIQSFLRSEKKAVDNAIKENLAYNARGVRKGTSHQDIPKGDEVLRDADQLKEELAQLQARQESLSRMIAGEEDIPQDLIAKAQAAAESKPQKITAREQAMRDRQTSRRAELVERFKIIEERERILREARARELGSPEDVRDPALHRDMLIQKHGADVNDQPPILQPSRAGEALMTARNLREEGNAVLMKSALDEMALDKRELELIEAVKSNITEGRTPKSGAGVQSGLLLAKWKSAIKLRNSAKSGKGINRPLKATETLANYRELAIIDALERQAKLAGAAEEVVDEVTGVVQLIAKKMADPEQLKVSTARELNLILGDVHKDTGAKAYIIENGKKLYGRVASASKDPTGTKVDFVPAFGPNREARLLDPKDITLEYDAVRGGTPDAPTPSTLDTRTERERGIFERSRAFSEDEVLNMDPLGMGQTYAELRQGVNVKSLQTSESFVKSIAELDKDIEVAKKEFFDTLRPAGPMSPSGQNKTTKLRAVYKGYVDIMGIPAPFAPSGKVALGEAQDLVTMSMNNALIREYVSAAGVAVDDPAVSRALATFIETHPDPGKDIAYLFGKSMDPQDLIRESKISNVLPRKVRSMLNFVTGNAFMDDNVRGLSAWFSQARSAVATRVGYSMGGIEQLWREEALLRNVTTDRRPHAMRLANGDKEVEVVLSQHYEPPPVETLTTDTARGYKAITDLPDDLRIKTEDWLSRQMWAQANFPEFFAKLPQSMKEIGITARAMTRVIHELSPLGSTSGVSTAAVNRMLVTDSIRGDVHAATFESGHPFEVIAEAVRIGSAKGKDIGDILDTGGSLLRSEPIAAWESLLGGKLARKLGDLAGKDAGITYGVGKDIAHTQGNWTVRSLDKWKVKDANGVVDETASRDLQDSMKVLLGQLNGVPGWKGMQKLSQSVSNLVLTLDANIVSQQGYAAMSSKGVWELANAGLKIVGLGSSNNQKVMSNYVKQVAQVTTDEGFHSWFRSRQDDIFYYASLGLRTGVESFTAGPKLDKLPLEGIPYVGRIFKGGREFNDLQFNRWLMYLKVRAVDMNLEKAHAFRNLGSTLQKPWRGIRGLEDIVEEAGGESAYLMSQPEHVVKAAIRTVNNKLGGIDLNAQGLSAQRQALEQIMTIVPGYFRAQSGQLTTALTRPHSVEGWLAVTGMAEEMMFAAAVAGGLAMLTGNTDKLNFTDMSSPDWFAVPFDDSYMPLIPRTALPRALYRAIQEVAVGGEDEKRAPGEVLKSFAQGRMSPLVNGALSTFYFDEDFLGRKYEDKKDRVFAGITSLMPIFAENLVTDAREAQRSPDTSLAGAVEGALRQTPGQFVGKSQIPRRPIERLDTIAQEFSEGEVEKWKDLTPTEQEQLLKDDKVRGVYDDFEFYNERRASPKDHQVDAAFAQADAETTRLRTEVVRFPDGKKMSMPDAYDLLLAGEMDGDEYREKRQYVNGQVQQAMTDMELNLKRLGVDLDESHDAKVKRISEMDREDSTLVLTQMAIWDAEKIQPDQFSNKVTVNTPNGPTTFFETDWDAFQRAREDAMEAYPNNIQLLAGRKRQAWDDEGNDAYRLASEQRSVVEETPRYRGLDVVEGDTVDAMISSFRDLKDEVRMRIGLPGSVAPLPKKVNEALRIYAVQRFAEQGLLKNENDVKLAAIAILMDKEPIIVEAMRNPDQVSMLIQNPDVLLFYPYLMGRVPMWMRGQLPTVLQPRFDAEHAFDEVGT